MTSHDNDRKDARGMPVSPCQPGSLDDYERAL
jgi:hypothetical protein